MQQQMRIIDRIDQLQEVYTYIQDQEYIAFDTETTGLKRSDCTLGFSLCADSSLGWYVILKKWDTDEKRLKDVIPYSEVHTLLTSLKSKHLVMHNAIFDCIRIKLDFNISLIDSVHTDTMALSHIIDENRSNRLKDLGVSLFGEFATDEQREMVKSIEKNGGKTTKQQYELYKADAYLIAKYGAKDAILTFNLFNTLIEDLFKQELNDFFYNETMPLLRGPTFDLNFTGLRVDQEMLGKLKSEIQVRMLELMADVQNEIQPLVKEKYPKGNFNINSPNQLSWLLFERLGQEFNILTPIGRQVCKALGMSLPYSKQAKFYFKRTLQERKGTPYVPASVSKVTGKSTKPKLVGDWYKYVACDKTVLQMYAKKFEWVEKFLLYKKEEKILNTYIDGIRERMQYGVIYPSFNQIVTPTGRYSSSNPNFQNLPRKDKRVKKCIIARPGNIFVGADYEQLEPRVFTDISGDDNMIQAFEKGEDFYAVIGVPVFGLTDCSLYKDDPNSFANKYPDKRDQAKIFSLATPYGRMAAVQASMMNIPKHEAQELIDRYFEAAPKVKQLMENSHEEIKSSGTVKSVFGRVRHIPAAKTIVQIYGNKKHSELPYDARNLLNMAMNFKIQSTAASIMNRAAIMVKDTIVKNSANDPMWNNVKIVMQIHDELILEGPEELGEAMVSLLQLSMETAAPLKHVKLVAKPKKAYNIADLK